MIKIITYLIKKTELHLSKKENKLQDKTNPSKKLKLYRDLLDRIDKYVGGNHHEILRHYIYFTIKIDRYKEQKWKPKEIR